MIDGAKCSQVRQELEGILKALGDEMDLHFHVGNIRYGETSMKINIEASVLDLTGAPVDQASVDFKYYSRRFDLPADALGETFKSGGTSYKITGLVTRRPKYPINAERTRDGKRFKFPASVVRAALLREGKIAA